MADIINGIPKTERIWVTRITKNNETFYVTSKIKDRSMYYFYKVVNGKAVKIGKSKLPTDLECKYIME